MPTTDDPAAPGPGTPWSTDTAALAAALGTDVDTGLSAADATARLAHHGPNEITAVAGLPAWRRLAAQFADPLVYLLIGALAISLTAWAVEGADGTPFEAIVIAAVLLVNGVLGYVQEMRAEEAVAALRRLTAASATVVRDGATSRVDARDVVPGDVLVVAEGDAVNADARLTQAAALTVAEAALTGESEAVLKDTRVLGAATALGDRTNMLFAGTAVTRGRGRAIVTATGMGTEMGRIATLLERTRDESTPLQREIRYVGRVLSIGVLVIAAVVVAAILVTTDVDEATDVVDVLLVGVSLAVAAVPEGLPAVLSVVLALGVQRMARRNAIVKQLSSVETLGSASVICSDKTGTLTRNQMTIRRIVTASGTVDVTGSGYAPEGALLADGRPLAEGPLLAEVRALLAAGTLANDARLRREGDDWTVDGDPTEASFLVAAAKAGFEESPRDRFARVGEVPFTSERKLMSTVHRDERMPERFGVVTKGAPDVLLGRCTYEQVGTDVRPLDERRRATIRASVDALADEAFRTLAAAYRPLPAAPDPVGEEIEHELVFVGIVGIIDPPRPEATAAIAEAHAAGIRVVMITGDHPRTARRIAEDLGVIGAGAPVLSGPEIDALDDGALSDAARSTAVYARVAPEHKLRIVDALQADGNVVAMTGDGVNDAPALKSADIGVAMGIAGTDVSKEAARMILTDDNFATIVAAVREGRGIFSNIRKFLRYLLSSNVGEVITMLLGVVAARLIGLEDAGGDVAVPLLATQILWINLLTDSAPALAMGVDPPPQDVMARPPRRLCDRVIDREMRIGVVFVGAVMALVSLLALDIGLPGGLVEGSGTLTEARTMAFTTLVLAQLFNCFNARSDRVSAFHRLFTNRWLWVAVGLSAAAQVLVVSTPFLNDAFDTAPLDLGAWLLCIALASGVLWADEARKLARRALARPA